MIFKTEQEAFWAGDFGNEYIQRNQGEALLASNLSYFSQALRNTKNVKTAIEFGANIGMNLKGTSNNCFYHGVYECNLLKLINTNFSKLNY